MSHRNVYQKLGFRIAGEVQLLAEERWIVETLSKIKKQRNSLQIERLHLESLKAQLRSESTNESQKKYSNTEDVVASTSAVDLMQNANTGKGVSIVDFKVAENRNEMNRNNEATCNEEQLNLMVTNPIFRTNPQNLEYSIEEDESDVDESDNIVIDIDMLMNGFDQANGDF